MLDDTVRPTPATTQRRRWPGEAALDLIVVLRSLFPQCFTLPPRPLAVGIDKEIIAALGPLPALHRALGYWTRRQTYRRALAVAMERVNLDGTSAGRPSADQVTTARRS